MMMEKAEENLNGLGSNVTGVIRSTFIVSDLQKSVDFYSNVMRLEMVEMVPGNRATFDAKKMIIELKDVPNSHDAIEYLTQNNIPFEVNVSVPKGAGKAVSEGGSNDNTVGQAFIRDPDGYYFEICNCHVLADFIHGLLSDDDRLLHRGEGHNIMVSTSTVWVSSVLVMKAIRSKKRCKDTSYSRTHVKPLPLNEQPKEADPVILKNFKGRRSVYGDICQSFSDDELEDILRQANNSAPPAILLMKQRIEGGKVQRKYIPPAYFVGGIDESAKFEPEALVAGADEKGKHMDHAPDQSLGVSKLIGLRSLVNRSARRKQATEVEEKKQDEADEEEGKMYPSYKPIDLAITSVDHIALIVSDVGRSSYFYSGILGLQQVRRPDFDRHGAWFSGVNMEIHLILGNPLAPRYDMHASEANVIWLEVEDRDVARAKLFELAASSRDGEHDDIHLEMIQGGETEEIAYLRDPDGYVLGIRQKMKGVPTCDMGDAAKAKFSQFMASSCHVEYDDDIRLKMNQGGEPKVIA